jgi:hypothetical protein
MRNEAAKTEPKAERQEAMKSYSTRFEPKEMTMKITSVVKGLTMFAALGIACLLPVTAHAQAEIAPDVYDVVAPQPIVAAQPVLVSAKIDATAEFRGNFTLTHDVTCSGWTLAPGVYSLSVKSDGTNRVVTIQRNGADMIIRVREVSPRPAESQSALVLRHKGPARTLEAVYVQQLNAMLYLDGNSRAMGNSARRERLPIS